VLTRETKADRVNLRVPRSIKQIWQRAAEAQGRSLSDYILEKTTDSAIEDIKRIHVIELTLRDQRQLLSELNAPVPEPTARMEKMACDYENAVRNGNLVVSH
jgi:uncharacterized protein (DUF1778 family)